MVRTFYDVLGVSPSATAEDVEAAYRERLKDTHPDLGEEGSSTDAVKAVIEAGDVLTDEEERLRYDRLGHEAYVTVTDTHDPNGEPSKRSRSTEQDRARTSASTEDHEYPPGRDKPGHRRRASVDDHEFSTGSHNAGYRRRTGVTNSATANVNPEGVPWATRSGTPSYESNSATGYAGPRSERSILLLSTLVAYPILAVSSLVPQFPLGFRVVIGACAIALVIYLVAVPSISIPVFGFWTLITAILIGLGNVPLLSIESFGAIVATAGPLSLALFSSRRL
ncbi:J domain-containing protein [Halorhabdus amylolytica]|uniref:J domain-containing protein n=1 Tax=Halorhabdus amylolytica TaxID=2559573 RepID=UPI00145BCEF5|nr:J domain-containing protein [Halorhabdus amylolytica]